MTALFTWCLPSQATNSRCPCAQLGNICCNPNARMHTSTLSFDTSIPATTGSFCAIVHSLPCSFGLEALATVRVEEDTGAVPRSVTGSMPLGAAGSVPATGGSDQPPVRTFCQIFWTQGRRECRVHDAPTALRAQQKKTHAGQHRYAEITPALPAQWLYGLLRALLGVRAP